MTVIKRALQEHIDLDPRTTLKILCGQCILDTSDDVNNEDKLLRAKLRALVLQFLAEKFRVCISRAVQSEETESTLLKGMLEVRRI